jgi:hypothetical protein
MKLTTLVLAAALAAGCAVRNDEGSFMVGTKIIAATAPTAAASTACVYTPDTAEAVFGAFDPTFGYVHAVVVENRMAANAAAGPGRVNTNDFQVEGATITTDVLVGHAQSIGAQTVPANGLIKVGSSAPVSVTLAQPGAIEAGSTVRFNVQVFGTLLDGSKVRTNRYEYAAEAVAGFVPPAPTCTAPAVPFACEGAHQDTTVICR